MQQDQVMMVMMENAIGPGDDNENGKCNRTR